MTCTTLSTASPSLPCNLVQNSSIDQKIPGSLCCSCLLSMHFCSGRGVLEKSSAPLLSSRPYITAHKMLSIASSSRSALIQQGLRYASTTTAPLHHRIVIVGGGTAGVTVAAQLEKAYKSEKRPLNKGDIAIIEPSELHHCRLIKLSRHRNQF